MTNEGNTAPNYLLLIVIVYLFHRFENTPGSDSSVYRVRQAAVKSHPQPWGYNQQEWLMIYNGQRGSLLDVDDDNNDDDHYDHNDGGFMLPPPPSP